MTGVDMTGLAIPKREELKSEKHRRWVSEHACVVCTHGELFLVEQYGERSAAQAAHVSYVASKYDGPRGKGEKARDIWTLPLCTIATLDHHGLQHAWKRGEKAFWDYMNIDPEPICLTLAERSPDPKVRDAYRRLAPLDGRQAGGRVPPDERSPADQLPADLPPSKAGKAGQGDGARVPRSASASPV